MLGLSSITSLPDGRAGLTPVADKAEDVDEVPSPEHSPPIAGGGEGGWGGGGAGRGDVGRVPAAFRWAPARRLGSKVWVVIPLNVVSLK